jgi:hypothetical protein
MVKLLDIKSYCANRLNVERERIQLIGCFDTHNLLQVNIRIDAKEAIKLFDFLCIMFSVTANQLP